MSVIEKGYRGICQWSTWLQSPLLLAIRLMWGILFFLAGVQKFGNIDNLISYFGKIHIVWPVFNAYLVATVETVGGLLLIVGFLTRLAAIPLAVVMIVAFYTAHYNAAVHVFDNPENFLKQSPLTYLYSCLVLTAFGAGYFSVDGFWRKGR